MGPRQDSYFAGMRGSVRAFYSALLADRALPVDAAQAAGNTVKWARLMEEGRSLIEQADEVEVNFQSGHQRNTRFAANQMSTAGSVANTSVFVGQ